MNIINILVENFFNGQDIFTDYEALTSEEDKIVLCEEICKEFADQLDNNNTSNVERVAEFLDKLEPKYGLAAISNFITIDRIIKYNIDIDVNGSLKFNKFGKLLLKTTDMCYDQQVTTNFYKFKFERRLLHHPELNEISYFDHVNNYTVKRTEHGFEHILKNKIIKS